MGFFYGLTGCILLPGDGWRLRSIPKRYVKINHWVHFPYLRFVLLFKPAHNPLHVVA